MGMMPTVMPMLTKAWKASRATTPAASRAPKGSRATAAMRRPRQSSSPSRAMAPAKPSSSPITVEMKSVFCSGTYWRLVWVPRR
jgi:hypothetical protein